MMPTADADLRSLALLTVHHYLNDEHLKKSTAANNFTWAIAPRLAIRIEHAPGERLTFYLQ
jgi:hypothetical protein